MVYLGRLPVGHICEIQLGVLAQSIAYDTDAYEDHAGCLRSRVPCMLVARMLVARHSDDQGFLLLGCWHVGIT